MRYWDASAVVALCVEEDRSPVARSLLAGDPGIVVWWGMPLEAASAFARLRRMGGLAPDGEQGAREVLARYQGTWTEVQPSALLRDRAMRLLSIHDLRAGDALQLAAAIAWAGEAREGREVACLDVRLAAAARLEGFRVLPATAGGRSA